MQQKILIIGDVKEDDQTFSEVCQKIFLSTPVMVKNVNNEPDVLMRALQSDVVFIRIDQNYSYYFELSIRLKKESPNIRVVWIAENGNYALPAFETDIDAYFELPVTEAKIGAVKKRLRI